MNESGARDMPSDAYGFAGAAYNQIIVFRSGAAMNTAIAANPHMTAIMGADGYTKEMFPGVYIAGIKYEANPHGDISGDGQEAIQRRYALAPRSEGER